MSGTWKRRTLAWKETALKRKDETIWADGSDLDLDAEDKLGEDLEEIGALFMRPRAGDAGAKEDSPLAKRVVVKPKKIMANLIDGRRATNAGIAFKNIKMANAEVVAQIVALNAEAFTAVQITLLIEYWPTAEERALLTNFNGDDDTLNEAEVFMRDMCGVANGQGRLRAMLFQATFDEKIAGVTRGLSSLSTACDDVKLSGRLRSMLRLVLLLGNKVNEDTAEAFTLDSLLKLSAAKAQDRKTTILDYLVMLAQRMDADLLRFSEDLTSAVPASRVLLNEVRAELRSLDAGLAQAARIAEGGHRQGEGSAVRDHVNRMEMGDDTVNRLEAFCGAAAQRLEAARGSLASAESKFAGVLRYMNEAPTLSPAEFFSTLAKFTREFNAARDRVLKKQEAENRKKLRQQSMRTMRRARAHSGQVKPLQEAAPPLSQRRSAASRSRSPADRKNSTLPRNLKPVHGAKAVNRALKPTVNAFYDTRAQSMREAPAVPPRPRAEDERRRADEAVGDVLASAAAEAKEAPPATPCAVSPPPLPPRPPPADPRTMEELQMSPVAETKFASARSPGQRQRKRSRKRATQQQRGGKTGRSMTVAL